MIDNTKFNAQLANFCVEVSNLYNQANMTASRGVKKTDLPSYRYVMDQATELADWITHWLNHNGSARSPGSFLLFYSALVLKNDEYSKAGQPEHKIAGNREFAKYTARLMETLVSCVS